MAKPMLIAHPHITKSPDVCGGSPIIAGTRFPVRSVVFYCLKLGLTPDEVVEKFPYLSLSRVYDALPIIMTTAQKSNKTSLKTQKK